MTLPEAIRRISRMHDNLTGSGGNLGRDRRALALLLAVAKAEQAKEAKT